MRFLRFEDTTINIDRAVRIDDDGISIIVDFAPAGDSVQPLNLRLEGRDAAALRQWLAVNAEDMSQLGAGSTGEPLDDPKPYVSPR
ncbi:MAG TPA: hypothetical protein VLA19_01750 [Herpetosiphonaceae bacterium]|nr:hypothetical protein [Herpetosiphonaceae bacterium]